MNDEPLLPLVDRLKACPSHDTGISEKSLFETWKCYRQTDLEHGDELTPSVMAALILYDDEQFAELLNEQERSQLSALAKAAVERYQQLTKPPNKLGKLIASIIKKDST